MKPFDIQKLVSLVSKELQGSIPAAELTELLSVGEEGYQKDSPLSVGKGLKVISIAFSGSKTIGAEPESFTYERKFTDGVYLWVGDNLVGKSSIFKVIKLALTGSKSLKRDVETWINEIWLEFGLGTKVYTVHIVKGAQGNYQFQLKNGEKSQAEQVESDEGDMTTLFDGGIGAYEEYMQGFFFRELDYYALQWTQRPAKKDNPALLTANASWKTYFKSVYLEAEDYNVLVYGQQSELIFQMLLGLELTYPINRLKIKRELLLNDLGLLKVAAEAPDQADVQKRNDETRSEIAKVMAELEALDGIANNAANSSTGNEGKLEQARKKYREAVHSRSEFEKEVAQLSDSIVTNRRRYNTVSRQVDDYAVEIGKKARGVSDLVDYLEIGAFFNGLEVKSCPNCNHAVEKYRVQHEKSHGTCRLCEHDIVPEEFDRDAYELQLDRLQSQKRTLEQDQLRLKGDLYSLSQAIENDQDELDRIEKSIEMLDIGQLQNQVSVLERAIGRPVAYDWRAHVAKVADLTARKTLLEQSIAPDSTNKPSAGVNQKSTEEKIRALEIAEQELKKQREERSSGPVKIFEELYLKQLHSLGLPHYERVELKPNFKVTYYMHGNELSFDEVSPGEQLRAKLGLYISLIEMDVEHQFGRHPRFIILDSPAKEEGDKRFIEGIASTLQFIQQNFGDQLQVFVGTAQRELVTAIDADRVEVKPEGEFFF